MTYRGAPGTADPATALRGMPKRIRTHPQAMLIATMTEEELLRSVVALAETLGCLVQHQRPAQISAGRWRTTIQGHVGFPDLVIAGPRGTLIRESKSMRGKKSPEQHAWITRLVMGGIDAGWWTPEDWYTGRIRREVRAIA